MRHMRHFRALRPFHKARWSSGPDGTHVIPQPASSSARKESRPHFHPGARRRPDHGAGIHQQRRRHHPVRRSPPGRRLLGLVPRRYKSGKVDYSGRISKAGDSLVRALLFEAAHVLMSRVKRACRLKQWAEQVALKVGLKKAKVALARKLAVLLARL
jgi:hypothetical protein